MQKMDISTFSILFIIQKGKTNQEGKAPILARITINKQMVHISTRQSVPPQRWLPKECKTIGLTKEEKQINRFLEDFKGGRYDIVVQVSGIHILHLRIIQIPCLISS